MMLGNERRRAEKKKQMQSETTKMKRKAYWSQYTQREDVKANRKRRNDAYYGEHRDEYLQKRCVQRRAKKAAASATSSR